VRAGVLCCQPGASAVQRASPVREGQARHFPPNSTTTSSTLPEEAPAGLRACRQNVWYMADGTDKGAGAQWHRAEGKEAENRGQRAEGQRAEGRGQRAEGSWQRAEGRGQRAEGRGQRADGRGHEGRGHKHGAQGHSLAGAGRVAGRGSPPPAPWFPGERSPMPECRPPAPTH